MIKRYSGIHGLLHEMWGDASPTHAWVRYILSVGVPREEFSKSYLGFNKLSMAFGRRALVSAVILDEHEIEVCELAHQACSEAQHKVVISFPKKTVSGGTHLLLAVGSDESEGRCGAPPGLDAVEALEAILRAAIGNSALVDVRHTQHMEVATGKSKVVSPDIRTYGTTEAARTDKNSIDSAIELVSGVSALQSTEQRRLMLGLRWSNVAFKSHDLLSAWTGLEILAGGHGERVYRFLSRAYGEPRASGKILAKRLGIDRLYAARNAQAHRGISVHCSPQAASLLLALAHDLAREMANLPAQRNAERVVNILGGTSELVYFEE